MTSIVSLGVKFDPRKILMDLSTILDVADRTRWLAEDQLSIRSSTGDDWFDGIGSLATPPYRSTRDFTTTNSFIKGMYLGEVVDSVEEFAATMGKKIGRIRFLNLKPKACYTWHIDIDEFRFHVPVVTNPGAMFISGDSVERMPIEGQLYQFFTRELHTAINAWKTDRLHLVFDTYV